MITEDTLWLADYFGNTNGENGQKNEIPYGYEWGKKVCEKWGVPYLDLFHLPYDTKILNQDLIHPNTYGYDYLGAIIVPFVRKMKPCEMK